MEAKKVAFSLEGVEFDYSEQFAMGAYIADYSFDKYKSEKKNKKLPITNKKLVDECFVIRFDIDLPNIMDMINA